MRQRAPVRVGVAGWDYPDWKGVLYPTPRPRGFDPVRYLASYIDLIEINSTFYRPPTEAVAERWAERVARLDRRFTYERDSVWTKKSLRASARSTAHAGYVRVHGRNYMDWFRKDAGRDARYDYLYSAQEPEPWVERTEAIARDGTTENVDVVFNNHYKAQAVVNAVQFKALLHDEPATVPPLLYESYPDELALHAYPQDPVIQAA
ncbi:MAG TPA: DUF72 domain-containing protein [Longimicrobiales bacterium]